MSRSLEVFFRVEWNRPDAESGWWQHSQHASEDAARAEMAAFLADRRKFYPLVYGRIIRVTEELVDVFLDNRGAA